MYGYCGRILKVDLSSGEIIIDDIDPKLCNDYIGGRGMGVAMIASSIHEQPYSEQMPLIFATGPLVGTGAPSSGRLSVVSRSPLTNTVFDCSAGGRFATAMKRYGLDVIYITGLSRGWVSLIIDDEIRLEDASTWEGLNIAEITQGIGDDYSLAAIGLAGERLVRYASIAFDGHYFAGRGGLGAVMGFKRLKFIAIRRKTGHVLIKDQEGLKEAQREIMRLLRASPAVYGEFGLSRYGTAALVDVIHARRLEPTANFRGTYFQESSRYAAYTISERYRCKSEGCMGCPVLCKKRGAQGEIIPEYETLSHFGALNQCSDLSAIVHCNNLCNDYGIDTISAASTIACYGELNNKKVSPAELPALLISIAKREGGLGDSLAEGSARYALSMGHPEASMSVKSLELPAYDPRGAYGMALGYAVSARGGCHLRSYPIGHEILRKPVSTDRFSFEGKARIIKISEDLNAVVDSLTACRFLFFAASLEEYAKALNAVTGYGHDVQSLLAIGERICRLERYLNNRLGFTSLQDDLPERFFTEEGSSSEKIKVLPIDRGEFLKARARYYKIRGASEDGVIGKSPLC